MDLRAVTRLQAAKDLVTVDMRQSNVNVSPDMRQRLADRVIVHEFAVTATSITTVKETVVASTTTVTVA
jgi:hypothetical protein